MNDKYKETSEGGLAYPDSGESAGSVDPTAGVAARSETGVASL